MANHQTKARMPQPAQAAPRTGRFTLTEALTELRSLDKRIKAKREAIRSYLARQAAMADPFHAEGGTSAFITRELEGIETFEERVLALRGAIYEANSATKLEIGDETRTLAEWLTWRTEIAYPRQRFLQKLYQRIKDVRREALARGTTVVTATIAAGALGAPPPAGVIVNVNERELVNELEGLDTMLSQFEGQLAVKNATTMVTV